LAGICCLTPIQLRLLVCVHWCSKCILLLLLPRLRSLLPLLALLPAVHHLQPR
jgi:hypothetical protein